MRWWRPLSIMRPMGSHVTGRAAQSGRASMPSYHSGAVNPPEGFLAYSENEFLSELGRRVRAMRAMRDMSRRELARRARISERYIARIEAGKGNVSIVLLLRIAHAVRVD